MNGLDVQLFDIGNVYLNLDMEKKLYFLCVREFGR